MRCETEQLNLCGSRRNKRQWALLCCVCCSFPQQVCPSLSLSLLSVSVSVSVSVSLLVLFTVCLAQRTARLKPLTAKFAVSERCCVVCCCAAQFPLPALSPFPSPSPSTRVNAHTKMNAEKASGIILQYCVVHSYFIFHCERRCQFSTLSHFCMWYVQNSASIHSNLSLPFFFGFPYLSFYINTKAVRQFVSFQWLSTSWCTVFFFF